MTARHLWFFTALIAMALAASLAWAGARLWAHMEGETAVMPLAVSAPAAPQNTATDHDIDAITALAPFGSVAAVDAPQTAVRAISLDIVLRGVLVDPDPAQSRAFVLMDGATSTLQLGEMVQSAELVAINADTITFNSDEGLHIVGFDGLQDGDEQASGITTVSEDNPNDPFARLAAAIVPGNGSIDLSETKPPETTDDYIDLWRDRITQSPEAAMESIGVELVENGYRVKPNPNEGITLAGLRPGDVVTRINGQAVGNLDIDRQLYNDVAAAGIARLEVVRDGQALLLTFPLR